MILLCVLLFELCGCGSEIRPSDRISSRDLDSLFDAAYVAGNSFEDFAGTKRISNGKPARLIEDIIGDKDLKYNGEDSPSDMWPTPPVYHEDEAGGYILLPNILNTRWGSKEFTKIPQPYDVYVVLRDLEAVPYEGYFAVGFGLRNRGDHLAINRSDEGNFPAPTLLEFNKRTIVRIRYDGGNSRMWLNNVEVPGGPVNVGSDGIVGLGYGTNSHVAQHDFYGMWVKFGTLTSAEHKVVYDQLAEIYKPGEYPNKPFANKIKVEWNNTLKAWSANYEFVNPLGFPEDVSKTEYQWYLFENGKDLNTTHALPGLKSQSKILTRLDFLTQFPPPHTSAKGNLLMVSVKVYDTQGNSWRFLRSQFGIDNVD